MKPAQWLVLLACFTIPATATHVVDGDTFDMIGSAWLNINIKERVRVLDVDAWEMKEPLGPAAKEFAMKWLTENRALTLTTCKRDSFGRILAIVKNAAGQTLAQALKDAGMAKPEKEAPEGR